MSIIDPICPSGYTFDKTICKCIKDIPTGEVLYDSNIHGKWNNGVKRTVTKTEGSQLPNGKGLFLVGKGNNLRLEIDGNGVGTFYTEGEMNDRFYIKVTNYNALLEYDFMFKSSTIKQHMPKLRCRHEEPDPCRNRFGGFQTRVGMDRDTNRPPYNTCSMQLEYCHPDYRPAKKFSLPKDLQLNQWYGMRFSIKDNATKTAVVSKTEMDFKDGVGYRTIGTTTDTNLDAYMIDEALYAKESYVWFRINTSGGKNSIAYRNIKITKI
jgi:hypothetical protein